MRHRRPAGGTQCSLKLLSLMAFLLNAGTDSPAMQGLILSAAEAARQAPYIPRKLPPRLLDLRGKRGR